MKKTRTTFEMYANRYKKRISEGLPHEQAKQCVPKEYHQLMFGKDGTIIDPKKVIYILPTQIKDGGNIGIGIALIIVVAAIALFIIKIGYN